MLVGYAVMVLTIARIAAGGRGASYLINSVGREAEHMADLDDARVVAYFHAAVVTGEPAGRWLGREAAARGMAGEIVTREELSRLFGDGRDPQTGELLGAAPRTFRPLAERLAALEERAGAQGWSPEKLAEEQVRVRAAGERQARTGYDLTFTAPKSVSILYGLSPTEALRRQVVDIHEEAVKKAITWVDEASLTRTGRDGIRQVDAGGILAAAFTHRTSRDGDPHLHTHVAVSAKVRGPDGWWRALDGRGLYRRVAIARNIYETELMAGLLEGCGVSWSRRESTGVMELTGCKEELIRAFSKRQSAIMRDQEEHSAPKKGERGYEAAHHSAWYRTRRAKDALGETTLGLGERWRRESAAIQPDAVKDMTGGRRTLPLARVSWDELVRSAGEMTPAASLHEVAASAGVSTDKLSEAQVSRLAEALDAVVPARRVEATLRLVASEKATWTEAQLASCAKRVYEAHPTLVRIETEQVAHPTLGMIERGHVVRENTVQEVHETTRAALGECRRLTPEEPTKGMGPRRADGTSVYEHVGTVRFTHQVVLDAEAKVLGFSEARGAVPFERAQALVAAGERVMASGELRPALSANQADTLAEVLDSERRLRVMVGPAGAGKTTVMGALVDAYQQRGLSVIGLAPYQIAAKELGEETGIQTMNLSRFLGSGAAAGEMKDQLRPGSLIVIDEAGTATSAQLAEVTRIAGRTGADVLLVGDHEQLAAIGAGGMFKELVERGVGVELADVQRFRDDGVVRTWEAEASLGLREGEVSALGAYLAHGRIHAGTREDLELQVFDAATAARREGKTTLVLTGTQTQADTLNWAIQTSLIEAGEVDHSKTVDLAGGGKAGVGDQIQTRANRHELGVANRDIWTIDALHHNGSISVSHEDGRRAHLGNDYVHHDVSLAYAGTIHAAQGATVDRSLVLVDGSTSSEALYVGMTRGREENHVYVAQEAVIQAGPGEVLDPIAVLAEVMSQGDQNVASATATERTQREELGSLAHLGPVLGDLVSEADRLVDVEGALGRVEPELARIIASEPGYAGLCEYANRLAHAGWDAETAIEKVASRRELSTAQDVASLLHWRLARTYGDVGTLYATAGAGIAMPARDATEWATLVYGPPGGDAARAVKDQMTERLGVLGERAEHEPWAAQLPESPEKTREAALRAVAAYREITGFAALEPIGPEPPTTAINQHAAWRVARDTLSWAERSEDLGRKGLSPVALVERQVRSAPDHWHLPEERRALATELVAVGTKIVKGPWVDDYRSISIGHLAVRDTVARLPQAVRQQAMKHWKRVKAQNRELAEENELSGTMGVDRGLGRGTGFLE